MSAGEGDFPAVFGQRVLHGIRHRNGNGGIVVVDMTLLADRLHEVVQYCDIGIIQLYHSLFHCRIFLLFELQRYEEFRE